MRRVNVPEDFAKSPSVQMALGIWTGPVESHGPVQKVVVYFRTRK